MKDKDFKYNIGDKVLYKRRYDESTIYTTQIVERYIQTGWFFNKNMYVIKLNYGYESISEESILKKVDIGTSTTISCGSR